MPITFRIRWPALIACSAAIAVGVTLGRWQSGRAVEKAAIETRLAQRANAAAIDLNADPVDIDALEYRRATVRGEFVRDWPVFLDNRPHAGVPGFYMLMPFKIADSNKHVLVLRGWLGRDPVDRTRLPETATPPGPIVLAGTVRSGPGRVLQLGAPPPLRPGAIVQNLDIAELASATGFRFEPFVLQQLTDTGDGLERDWPAPSAGIEKHQGYAFQWYALAAMAFIFFIVTGLRRGTS